GSGTRFGDVNGDGYLDLFVIDGPTQEALLVNRGDGTFQPAVQITIGTNIRSLVPGDFNGDGYLDLVAYSNDSTDLSLRLGRGDGTFADEVRLPTGVSVGGLLTGDFNGDGRLDLAGESAPDN